MNPPRHFCLISSLLLLVVLSGCGGETTPGVLQSEAEPEAENSPGAQSSESPSEPAASSTPASAGNLVREQGGTQWIGDIPLDVWYDDPLAIASTAGQIKQPTQIPETPGTAAPPQPEPMPMPMPMASADAGTDWKRIIPAELLEAEVTSIRNRFNADLKTVGSYNNSYLAIPPHAATLAVLSHIAKGHPGEIRWKENSPYIKHLAGQMIAEPLRRGPSSQRPLKEKFDNIIEILNGSVPATLEAPPENEPIAELAEMGIIMKRLENASKLIRVNGGTADAMKENANLIHQEAAVLGGLTQVLLDGYGFEGDEGFEKYVKNMVDATVELRENIKNDEFGKFELSVSKIFQACQQCHSEYRG